MHLLVTIYPSVPGIIVGLPDPLRFYQQVVPNHQQQTTNLRYVIPQHSKRFSQNPFFCPQIPANSVHIFITTKNLLQMILDGAATYSVTQELGAGCHTAYSKDQGIKKD
jgi:hypothetical protein